MIRTPAAFQEYPLGSPISLSRIPLKAPTPHESEAAEALLGLFSSRIKIFEPTEDHNMDTVDSDSALTNLSISTAPDIPFSPPFTPGDDLPRPSGYADHAFYDQTEPEINPEVYVPHLQKGRTSKVKMMLIALESLQEARISVMDLLLSILDGEFSEFYSHRLAFLCNTPRIRKVLGIKNPSHAKCPAEDLNNCSTVTMRCDAVPGL